MNVGKAGGEQMGLRSVDREATGEGGLMPRYFFHMFNQVWEPDREGREFPDRGAAQDFAVAFARDVVRERPAVASPLARVRIEVEDDVGETFLVLKFVDVVDEPNESLSAGTAREGSGPEAGHTAEGTTQEVNTEDTSEERMDENAPPLGEVAQEGSTGAVSVATASPSSPDAE
jgi:hypothetical protein